MKLKADRLPFAKATEADIRDGLSQKIVYSDQIKKVLDDVQNVVFDGSIDEYVTDDFLNGASVAGVAQLRDMVYFLLQSIESTPKTIVTDGSVYIDGQNQGGIDFRIFPVEIVGYGTLISPPIYKFINGGFSVRIFMGNQTVAFFEEQQLNSPATLIPYKDEDGEWNYIKV